MKTLNSARSPYSCLRFASKASDFLESQFGGGLALDR